MATSQERYRLRWSDPRLSGFGFARLMNVEDSDCVTISCCGEKADELVEEFGYGAPESWRNSPL